MRQIRNVRGWPLFLAGTLISACVGPALIIEPEQLANAVEGASYSATLSTDAGELRWAVDEGALPGGLQLDSETGIISGVPTTPGTYDFVVAVEEPRVPVRSGQRAYTLTVLEKLCLQLSLGTARVGVAYESTPTIIGGVPPYAVSLVGLPGGVDYDRSTGRVFGTWRFENDGLTLEMTVQDSGSPQQTATVRTTLVVHPVGVLIVTAALLPAGAVGENYSVRLEATDGEPPYRWLPESGVLPDGLHLDNDSGEVYGVPAVSAMTETFTLSVTDSDSPKTTDSRQFKLVIPVVIVATTLPSASVGVAYEQALGAVAGTGPYTWALISGELPDGLQLDASTGVISGTPTSGAQDASFRVQVTDSDTPVTQSARDFTILVEVP